MSDEVLSPSQIARLARRIYKFNRDEPLERVQPSETRRANNALHDYALMGPGRGLIKLYKWYCNTYESETNQKPPTKRLQSIKDWSTWYLWGARVERFDQIQRDKELAKWEERKEKLREADWNGGEELRRLVATFRAELPKFIRTEEKVVERDGEKMLVVTIGLNTRLGELANVEQVASGLQRLAANEPTANINLHGAVLDNTIARELERLADARKASPPVEAEGDVSGARPGADGDATDGGSGDTPTARPADPIHQLPS